MSDYYNVTTNNGDAAITAAIANNTKLNITHVAFGDGNGAVPTPSKTRTTLVKEVHRQAITKYSIHPTVSNWLIVEAIIPSDVGGFWIREIGLIADGILISHGSHSPFYKVAETNGVSEFRLKYTINIQDGGVVDLTLDESLIYATQAWVDEYYVPRDELVDNLTTSDATKPLAAKQGKKLQDEKAALAGAAFTGGISAPTLVAGNEDTSYPSLQFKPKAATNGAILEMAPSGMPYLAIRPKETLSSSTGQIAIYYFPNKTGIQTLATLTDNVTSASKWQTARTVSFSGAATGSFSIDGSANTSCVLTLSNSGVVAGTYASNIQIPSITVNDKGQITGISQQNIRSASVSQSGVVQLNNTLTSSATDQALTAAQGKALQDSKLANSSNLSDLTNAATARSNLGLGSAATYNIGTSGAAVPLLNAINKWSPQAISASYPSLRFELTNVDSGAVGKWWGFECSGSGTNSTLYFWKRSDPDTITGQTVIYMPQTAGTLALTTDDITGNAATATKFATPRTIGGVSFDGSANINLPGVNTQGNQNTTGNAATATKFATPRTIGGVSFDGSANINLPGVNTQGNQNTTGNAATATKWATTRTISLTGASTGSAQIDGSGNISIATTGLGVGQTWQDLTASRSLATTYTNSTGKPIMVSVTWEQSNQNEMTLTVGGISVDRGRQNQVGGGGAVQAIVPTGATYSVTSTGNSIVNWMELR